MKHEGLTQRMTEEFLKACRMNNLKLAKFLAENGSNVRTSNNQAVKCPQKVRPKI